MIIISVSSLILSSIPDPDLSSFQKQLLLLQLYFVLSFSKSQLARHDPAVGVFDISISKMGYLGIPILPQLVHIHLLIEEKVQACL